MSDIILEAEARSDMGKGASRRLRREEKKIPAIIYGGDKDPAPLLLAQNVVLKALENEAIYSSVFALKVDGKKEKVLLKDIQRHPYKPVVMHMDFQRVSGKDVLVRMVPLHFINEDSAPGVKDGGIITHSANQVEITCQAKDLPEFIEVDVAGLEMDGVIHLTDLTLPKGVEFAHDPSEGDHDQAVVSIHEPRVEPEPEPEEEQAETAADEVEATEQKSEGDEDNSSESDENKSE